MLDVAHHPDPSAPAADAGIISPRSGPAQRILRAYKTSCSCGLSGASGESRAEIFRPQSISIFLDALR